MGPITINAAYHAQAYTNNANAEYTGYAIDGMIPVTEGISLSAGYISTKQGNLNTAVANDNRIDS